MIFVNTGGFKTPEDAIISSTRILFMYHSYKDKKDFVGMDMCRKFLEMGLLSEKICLITKDGKKYKDGKVLPQEKDALTSPKAFPSYL